MVARVAIISITIVVIVAIAAGLGVYLARRQERIRNRDKGHALKGDLNRSEEQALISMLAQAATIMRNLGRNDVGNFDDPEILRADTRIDVGRWLARYDKTIVKETVSQ